jgi:diadenosine tetraphosphate (Ap4A) HIT family hydrolase
MSKTIKIKQYQKQYQKQVPNQPVHIPMPAIQKIRDIPLSNEQTKMATYDLDEKRLKDDEEFRSYQLFMMQQSSPQQQLPQQLPQQQLPQQQLPQQQLPQQLPQQHPQIYLNYQMRSQVPPMQTFSFNQDLNNQFMFGQIPQPSWTVQNPSWTVQNQVQSFQEENSYPWTQPPLPEFLDPKKSIDLKLIRKPKKKDTRCYTCKPRGKVKKHMINTSGSGKFIFHHDMHKRPVIIMTPARHIENIYELTPDELNDLFKSLKEFAAFWNIDDYQLSFNMGKWQNHEHFHCKIRISEKIIGRMRRDHFEKIKMDARYED